MKQLFLIVFCLLLLGVWLPLMAANFKGKSFKVEEEELVIYPNINHPPDGTGLEVMKPEAPPHAKGVPVLRDFSRRKLQPVRKENLPVQEVKRKKEGSPGFSFNFLYYLFYKFSLSGFFN